MKTERQRTWKVKRQCRKTRKYNRIRDNNFSDAENEATVHQGKKFSASKTLTGV